MRIFIYLNSVFCAIRGQLIFLEIGETFDGIGVALMNLRGMHSISSALRNFQSAASLQQLALVFNRTMTFQIKRLLHAQRLAGSTSRVHSRKWFPTFPVILEWKLIRFQGANN